MKKSDLKDGMVCKIRDDRDENMFVVLGKNLRSMNNFIYITNYCENLSHYYNDELDIIEIYSTKGLSLSSMLDTHGYGSLIWKREEPKEMTVAEIEELLGYPVKIVKE